MDSLVKAVWREPKTNEVANLVVYERYGNKWHQHILPGCETSIPVQLLIPSGKETARLEEIWVSSVSRTGMESERTKLTW